VILPYAVSPIFLGRGRSINALKKADESIKTLFVALQKDSNIEDPGFNDIHHIGVVANILQTLKLQDGSYKVLLEGIKKARLLNAINMSDMSLADVEIVEEFCPNDATIRYYTQNLISNFEKFTKTTNKVATDLCNAIISLTDPLKLVYTIATHSITRVSELQRLLELDNLSEKIELLIELLQVEMELFKLDEKIKNRVKSQIMKNQREYYLNEQMKAINKELGRDEEFKADIDELEDKIKNSLMNEEIKEKALKEVKKLRMMPPMGAESTVVRNYLDWLTSVPWGVYTEDKNDISKAEDILNRDHYGLEKVKERIIELLAVRQVSQNIKGPILCLVGPPGVGKTSLARSVAEALGRKFVRMSLGGLRDEAEIRGHRRTYIGALPGKIVQGIKRAGSMNPVFLLDEIDKLGSDFRGDPASALLEALDPEQNTSFVDHYLEVDLDLSKVFFITTANTIDTIPYPLRDRMEIITLSGYTELEKFHIARGFIIPKQLKIHNMENRIFFNDESIYYIIRHYTREAGVRNLERELSSVIRKSVRKIVKENLETVHIDEHLLSQLLGPEKYRFDMANQKKEIGMATGLAWTPYGGDILQIEVSLLPGSGKLITTGQLGDVMKESVDIALSVVKSKSGKFSIPAYKFKDMDIHLHVPEGAVPKDGPSAGVTITVALLSAFSGLPVDNSFAMTGEIILRGKVLPVGGIKEKVLAAVRSGIKKIVLPVDNKKDLTDIPKEVINKIQVFFVETIDEVTDLVICKL
jgi:ATP-dependent Lon protease